MVVPRHHTLTIRVWSTGVEKILEEGIWKPQEASVCTLHSHWMLYEARKPRSYDVGKGGDPKCKPQLPLAKARRTTVGNPLTRRPLTTFPGSLAGHRPVLERWRAPRGYGSSCILESAT